jgi:hypothetical protein
MESILQEGLLRTLWFKVSARLERPNPQNETSPRFGKNP